MTATDLVVIVAGLAGIGWVNWYFFVAGRSGGVSAAAGGLARGPQRARIVVKGGYSPSAVRVEVGRPVRLEFDRQETSGCTEEVVFPDFGIRTYLPAHRTTPVEFTPTRPGSYEFTCGMAMVRGRLIVEDAKASNHDH